MRVYPVVGPLPPGRPPATGCQPCRVGFRKRDRNPSLSHGSQELDAALAFFQLPTAPSGRMRATCRQLFPGAFPGLSGRAGLEGRSAAPRRAGNDRRYRPADTRWRLRHYRTRSETWPGPSGMRSLVVRSMRHRSKHLNQKSTQRAGPAASRTCACLARSLVRANRRNGSCGADGEGPIIKV